MPTVQFLDETQYTKAIGVLHRTGEMFRTRPTRRLIVSPAQLVALEKAGLLTKANGARKHRGTKTK
jgi:hypothetical protein